MYFKNLNGKIIKLDTNNYSTKYDLYYAYYKEKYNVVIPKSTITADNIIYYLMNDTILLS